MTEIDSNLHEEVQDEALRRLAQEQTSAQPVVAEEISQQDRGELGTPVQASAEVVTQGAGEPEPNLTVERNPQQEILAALKELTAEKMPELEAEWKWEEVEKVKHLSVSLKQESRQQLIEMLQGLNLDKEVTDNLFTTAVQEVEDRFTRTLQSRAELEASHVWKYHKKELGKAVAVGVAVGAATIGVRFAAGARGLLSSTEARITGGALLGGGAGKARQWLLKSFSPVMEKWAKSSKEDRSALKRATEAVAGDVISADSLKVVTKQVLRETLAKELQPKQEIGTEARPEFFKELLKAQAPELFANETELSTFAKQLAAIHSVGETTEKRLTKYMDYIATTKNIPSKKKTIITGIVSGGVMGTAGAIGGVANPLASGVIGAYTTGSTIEQTLRRRGIEERHEVMQKKIVGQEKAEALPGNDKKFNQENVNEVFTYLHSGLLEFDPVLKTRAQDFLEQAAAANLLPQETATDARADELAKRLKREHALEKGVGYGAGFVLGALTSVIGSHVAEKVSALMHSGGKKGIEVHNVQPVKDNGPVAPSGSENKPWIPDWRGDGSYKGPLAPSELPHTGSVQEFKGPYAPEYYDAAPNHPTGGSAPIEAHPIEVEIKGKIDTVSEAVDKALHGAPAPTQDAFIHRVLGDQQIIPQDEHLHHELLRHAVAKFSVSNQGAEFGKGVDVKNLVYEGNKVVVNADGSVDVAKSGGAYEPKVVDESVLRHAAEAHGGTAPHEVTPDVSAHDGQPTAAEYWHEHGVKGLENSATRFRDHEFLLSELPQGAPRLSHDIHIVVGEADYGKGFDGKLDYVSFRDDDGHDLAWYALRDDTRPLSELAAEAHKSAVQLDHNLSEVEHALPLSGQALTLSEKAWLMYGAHGNPLVIPEQALSADEVAKLNQLDSTLAELKGKGLAGFDYGLVEQYRAGEIDQWHLAEGGKFVYDRAPSQLTGEKVVLALKPGTSFTTGAMNEYVAAANTRLLQENQVYVGMAQAVGKNNADQILHWRCSDANDVAIEELTKHKLFGLVKVSDGGGPDLYQYFKRTLGSDYLNDTQHTIGERLAQAVHGLGRTEVPTGSSVYHAPYSIEQRSDDMAAVEGAGSGASQPGTVETLPGNSQTHFAPEAIHKAPAPVPETDLTHTAPARSEHLPIETKPVQAGSSPAVIAEVKGEVAQSQAAYAKGNAGIAEHANQAFNELDNSTTAYDALHNPNLSVDDKLAALHNLKLTDGGRAFMFKGDTEGISLKDGKYLYYDHGTVHELTPKYIADIGAIEKAQLDSEALQKQAVINQAMEQSKQLQSNTASTELHTVQPTVEHPDVASEHLNQVFTKAIDSDLTQPEHIEQYATILKVKPSEVQSMLQQLKTDLGRGDMTALKQHPEEVSLLRTIIKLNPDLPHKADELLESLKQGAK